MIRFNNSYTSLPEDFYQKISPASASNPKIININNDLAKFLGIDTSSEKLTKGLFSGNIKPKGSEPIAMVYAGHQFGSFVPRLGDGRAILLGELIGKDRLSYDIQLKGSGKTKFSRNGDGKCPLGPAIREYILSEAMYKLKIPTTRSLAIISTGEDVIRETVLPGAILVRVASSHIRVGTFEYFCYKNDYKNLRILADFSIRRHFPDLIKRRDKYFLFYFKVLNKQIKLVSKWLSVGFIHGVMNTDNTTISGETIDYGPCAFLDNFQKAKVFSSIDYGGRYSFENQKPICLWNMICLANALLPLFNDKKSAAKVFEKELMNFDKIFDEQYINTMSLKFGVRKKNVIKEELIDDWLKILEAKNLDYTNSYLELEKYLNSKSPKKVTDISDSIENFSKKLLHVYKTNNIYLNEVLMVMRKNNPQYIPRNHLIEDVIVNATKGNFEKFYKLIDVLNTPFKKKKNCNLYEKKPSNSEIIHSTFCGT